MYPFEMRYFLLPLLVTPLLSGCDPYRESEAQQKIDAQLSAPCVAAVQQAASSEADYRGFLLRHARVTEMAPGNYAIRVQYQVATLADPVGGRIHLLDCELRNGVVVALQPPGPI